MKLASLMDRTRDGALVVVSRDLTRYVSARPIAATLQAALDDWEHVAPRLEVLAEELELGAVPWVRFHEHDAMSPLPRAYQRINGAAYSADTAAGPKLSQRSSDGFLAPRQPIARRAEEHGVDLDGEVAVITGDVPVGTSADEATASIRLIMLANDITLRNLEPDEVAKGSGLLQSKPGSSFSPVAVTPDELGADWKSAKVALPLKVTLNGKPFGKVQAGQDMHFDFAALIAHAAKTRSLSAGSIIGSGTVTNKAANGGPGSSIADGGAGYASLADRRAAEAAATGAPVTSYLKSGDTVRIEMCDRHGHSIFGAIEQTVGA